ncbi:MAG: GxxExxY protein, partial [Cyclobacteriaceae bacterium]|nr:GxxExxY protein [Cyclobacteriaceae bacterium]
MEEDLTRSILDCAYRVHTALGPGLLESSYLECLYFELIQKGLQVEKQKPRPLIYNDVKLEVGYRIDLLVGGRIIVEIKSVDKLSDVHLAQILTYLRLNSNRFGLLINFNVARLK